MRLNKDKINIEKEKVQQFFNERAQKYDTCNPLVSVLYQDKNPSLAYKRHEMEVDKILPLLALEKDLAILDIGCGIGRWVTALEKNIKLYYGTDFSSELIKIAKETFKVNKRINFLDISIDELIDKGNIFNRKFDLLVFAGVMQYLNNNTLQEFFINIRNLCSENAQIYIRGAIAIDEPLTLKQEWSKELETEYNAIYRTYKYYHELLSETLLNSNFVIKHEGLLYPTDNEVNNRKETTQYFFILEKGDF